MIKEIEKTITKKRARKTKRRMAVMNFLEKERKKIIKALK